MTKKLQPEDMSLVPTGTLTREQWCMVVERLATAEKAVWRAKEEATLLPDVTAKPVEREISVRRGIRNALDTLEALAKEIALLDLLAERNRASTQCGWCGRSVEEARKASGCCAKCAKG
jgi:hypothetical protein